MAWPDNPVNRTLPMLVLAAVLAFALPAGAAEWHVATNGTAQGQGGRGSPWDIGSALGGQQRVAPGDTLWLHRGVYLREFENGGLGWPVKLAGRTNAPVHIRAASGERVTLDGGLNLQPPSTCLWLWDLELIVSDPRPDAPVPPDPTYKNLERPWGGLNVYTGQHCKFINLVIHDNAQGVSWWTASQHSELYGCLIYDNGWVGTDRGHGHAVYTQNRDGLKTIADCIFNGGFGYSLHAYGSERAFVDNYRIEGNIAYDANTFLIGGSQPSRGIQVVSNVFYGVPLQLGHSAPTNADCELRGNFLVNASLTVKRFHRFVETNNTVLGMLETRPKGTAAVLRPNRYDSRRAHLAVMNWERLPIAVVDLSSFLKFGERFRIQDPADFFGPPVLTGIADGKPLFLPVAGEFAAFVILKR